MKFNRTLPSVKNIINKHWDILQIDRNIKDSFTNKPVIAYRRNKNLRDFIGSNTIENNTKVIKRISSNGRKIGKCQPCFGRAGNLCCQQIKTTSTFKSDITEKVYNIFHDVNCKSTNLIYLMECTLCERKQYVGKCEWSFNRRINSHRNDVWRVEGPPCDKHFQQENHDFNKHAKFTVIEKIEKPPLDKKELRKLLELKEDKWMTRLQTVMPNGLNISLNYPQDITGVIK